MLSKTDMFALGLLVALSVLSTTPSVAAAESDFVDVLSGLGFTNVVETSIQTFPVGEYEITLYAEYADYRDQNNLTWYKIGTNDFNLIFNGLEGVPPGDPRGLVSPPLTKSFTGDGQFGLSLGSPDGIWYTETSRNSDGVKHAKVYRSLDDPSICFLGFENLQGGGDKNFIDMVVSLKGLSPGFVIPEPATIVATATSLVALFIYALRRRKK